MSVAEAGVFDFVRSRGTITVQSPVSTTEIFFPPTTYLKIPAAAALAGSGVPKGKLGGVDMPVMPQDAAGGVQWLVTTEASGHWYVDIVRSTAVIFGAPCLPQA